MTEYVVLLPGDESRAGRPPPRSSKPARCTPSTASSPSCSSERGHKVTGGAELAHSREAKLLRTAATATP